MKVSNPAGLSPGVWRQAEYAPGGGCFSNGMHARACSNCRKAPAIVCLKSSKARQRISFRYYCTSCATQLPPRLLPFFVPDEPAAITNRRAAPW